MARKIVFTGETSARDLDALIEFAASKGLTVELISTTPEPRWRGKFVDTMTSKGYDEGALSTWFYKQVLKGDRHLKDITLERLVLADIDAITYVNELIAFADRHGLELKDVSPGALTDLTEANQTPGEKRAAHAVARKTGACWKEVLAIIRNTLDDEDFSDFVEGPANARAIALMLQR